MKKIIIAVVCIAVGMVLALVMLPALGIQMTWLDAMRVDTRTVDVLEDFDRISIRGVNYDISMYPSYYSNDACRVHVCERGSGTAVQVVDGTLTITRSEDRPWYERLHLWSGGDEYVSIYLPEDFHGTVDVDTVSGDVYLDDMALRDLTVASTSGDIYLNSVTAENAMDLDSVSGYVWLWNCDGNSVTIDTVSGDVTGYFLTPKNFQASSTSGSVNAPRPDKTAGTCRVATVSGDIWLDLAID